MIEMDKSIYLINGLIRMTNSIMKKHYAHAKMSSMLKLKLIGALVSTGT